MNQEKFVASLSRLQPSSTFLTLKGYRNEHSEVADYNIVFNISYKSALEKSIALLKPFIPSNDVEDLAKKELIESYQNSLSKMETVPLEELEDNYKHFQDENGKYIKGIKLHLATNIIHLYGLVVNKKVIVPTSYAQKNKRELTKVKDRLRKNLPVSKFRQFKISSDNLHSISVQNISLLPP